MSYFGLIETAFKNGPFNSLEKGGSASLGMSTLKYPTDLGSADKAHYIIFYAKTQKNIQTSSPNFSGGVTSSLTNYAKETVSGMIESTGIVQKAQEFIGTAIETGKNTLTSWYNDAQDIFGIGNGNSKATENLIQNSIKKVTGSSFNFMRTSQTSDVIALYMPNTVAFTHNQQYEELELGSEWGGMGLAAGKSAMEAYKSGNSDVDKRNAMAASLTKSAVNTFAHVAAKSDALSLTGKNTNRLIASAITGVVSNPLLEVIYSSPRFRRFNFEFMFYPRSSKEALEVQNIINKFYYHQAPELVQESQGFLIPPSQFDIEMYYNGQQNPNIPTIATCVLEGVMVDYAPLGFSTYELPAATTPSMGGTGMPVAIRMLLEFREITYLTKEDFSG